LYLIRILIYLNKKNCDLIIDNDGMQKIILINKEPSYPMKLRKAAGQVSSYIGDFVAPLLHLTITRELILITCYHLDRDINLKNISGLNGGLGVDKNAF